MRYTDEQLKDLWEEFGDVLLDYSDEKTDGVLEKDWFIFEAGTDKLEIWDWFDEQHSVGLYKLMFKD